MVLFDEFADLMVERGSKKELETLLKRLGAKARAAGIHLVLGTQRTEASVGDAAVAQQPARRVSLTVTGDGTPSSSWMSRMPPICWAGVTSSGGRAANCGACKARW